MPQSFFNFRNPIWIICTVYLLAYTVLCVSLFVQRCSFIDAPYFIINMVNHSNFFFPLQRYSFVLTEFLPVLGIWLKAEFKTIALLYSISFPLVYFILFFVCFHSLKNIWLSLVLTLMTCVGVKYSFYVLPLEGMIGMVVAVTATGWMWKPGGSIWMNVFISALFACLIFFAHPLNFLIILYSAGYYLADNRFRLSQRSIFLLSFFFLFYLLKALLIPANPYDLSAIEDVKNNAAHFFQLQSHGYFLKWILSDYFWLPLIFAGILTLLMSFKKYWASVWYILSIVGFIALVNCRNYDDQLQFYIEHSLLSLSALVVLPLASPSLQSNINSRIGFIILSLSLILMTERLFTFIQVRHHFNDRISWQLSYVDKAAKTASRQLVVCQKDLLSYQELIPGKLIYETWFLSKIFRNEDAFVGTAWEMPSGSAQELFDSGFEFNKLNSRYFHFDSAGTEFICE